MFTSGLELARAIRRGEFAWWCLSHSEECESGMWSLSFEDRLAAFVAAFDASIARLIAVLANDREEGREEEVLRDHEQRIDALLHLREEVAGATSAEQALAIGARADRIDSSLSGGLFFTPELAAKRGCKPEELSALWWTEWDARGRVD
jgi:hypothetical protein